MSQNRFRQIIAIGGTGFFTNEEYLTLYRYILSQAPVKEPAVAFLATATGDDNSSLVKYYSHFSALACRPSHLPLFGNTPDLRSYILSQDVIYVPGGNTKSMLALWRDWGIDELLREAWESGVVLAGTSAGAICWFEQVLTGAWAGKLSVIDGLGFLPGSCVTHYSSMADRQPAYTDLVSKGEISAGYGIDDSVAIHFVNDKIHKTLGYQPDVNAYQVHKGEAAAKETRLEIDYVEQLVH